MNQVILIGRATADATTRYKQGGTPMAISSYILAVDRAYKRDGDSTADFIRCTAFGKSGEFAEKYIKKGVKIAVTGRIQTGSYTDKDGKKVYTTDVIVDHHEFVESKAHGAQPAPTPYKATEDKDGFMAVPDTISEELPFN